MNTIDDLINELKTLRKHTGGNAKVKIEPITSKRYNVRPLKETDVSACNDYWADETYIQFRWIEQ